MLRRLVLSSLFQEVIKISIDEYCSGIWRNFNSSNCGYRILKNLSLMGLLLYILIKTEIFVLMLVQENSNWSQKIQIELKKIKNEWGVSQYFWSWSCNHNEKSKKLNGNHIWKLLEKKKPIGVQTKQTETPAYFLQGVSAQHNCVNLRLHVPVVYPRRRRRTEEERKKFSCKCFWVDLGQMRLYTIPYNLAFYRLTRRSFYSWFDDGTLDILQHAIPVVL